MKVTIKKELLYKDTHVVENTTHVLSEYVSTNREAKIAEVYDKNYGNILASSLKMLELLKLAEKVVIEMDSLVDYSKTDDNAAQTALTNKAYLHIEIKKLFDKININWDVV